jgi:hypothetical protein
VAYAIIHGQKSKVEAYNFDSLKPEERLLTIHVSHQREGGLTMTGNTYEIYIDPTIEDEQLIKDKCEKCPDKEWKEPETTTTTT